MAKRRERLWHGGAPGRQVGDELLPPSRTGLAYTRLHMSLEEGRTEIGQRPDRVYVTADRELARAYAATWTADSKRHGGGSLYEVRATNLEPVDDLLSLRRGYYQTESARVVAVAEPCVVFDAKHLTAFQRVLDDQAAAKRRKQSRRKS